MQYSSIVDDDDGKREEEEEDAAKERHEQGEVVAGQAEQEDGRKDALNV